MFKKSMAILLTVITVFILMSCNNDDDADLSGSISPYKTYDSTTSGFDYVAFGVERHELGSLSTLGLSETEIDYINKPLGSSTALLSRKDIIDLGLLDEGQISEFNNYCDKTQSNHFKLAFIIVTKQDSSDYGKQMLDITNLDHVSDKLIKQGFGYHLFFESKKLDFNKIITEAEKVLNVDQLPNQMLNDSFAGIYLHNYINENSEIKLSFYVIYAELIIEHDKTFLDYKELKWFEIELKK